MKYNFLNITILLAFHSIEWKLSNRNLYIYIFSPKKEQLRKIQFKNNSIKIGRYMKEAAFFLTNSVTV